LPEYIAAIRRIYSVNSSPSSMVNWNIAS